MAIKKYIGLLNLNALSIFWGTLKTRFLKSKVDLSSTETKDLGAGAMMYGVSGVLPVSNGGTGSDSLAKINAGSATKLVTARTIQTNLASTTAASFDGSTNITPGVTGVLPVANGGTGVTDLNALAIGKANSAVNDGAGNVITDTYATKAYVNSNIGSKSIYKDITIDATSIANSTTYSAYPYAYSIAWNNITSDYYIDAVESSSNTEKLYDYAIESGTNTVTIYFTYKPSTNISIRLIAFKSTTVS